MLIVLHNLHRPACRPKCLMCIFHPIIITGCVTGLTGHTVPESCNDILFQGQVSKQAVQLCSEGLLAWRHYSCGQMLSWA